jgi:hypothetical protein
VGVGIEVWEGTRVVLDEADNNNNNVFFFSPSNIQQSEEWVTKWRE